MASAIEDYGLLSDMHTGALVSRTGSIDWLCFPRFDSPSVFGALLGTEDHGRWLLAPSDPAAQVEQRYYVAGTFVLQTIWRTATGSVRVTEFMPVHDRRADVVRRVEGITGSVRIRQELEVRPGYGSILPWVRRVEQDGRPALLAMSGPDALVLQSDSELHPEGRSHVGEVDVVEGSRHDFAMTWFPSHRNIPIRCDVDHALSEAVRRWQQWSSRCTDTGRYADQVVRSMLVLRALTHEDTGGIVAAPTTSLPEQFGGPRNWDYRFCWLRDAALTLLAMLRHGYADEALSWRNWLLRAVAGDPDDLQIMYGVGGERELAERELGFLPGYAGSRPVRIGNGAVEQFQGDVVGEVMFALGKLREAGGEEDSFSWPLQRALLDFAERHIDQPDQGIWEMRRAPTFFTHSRVMTWAAFDCGVRAVRDHGLQGPVDRWEALRDNLAAEIRAKGYNDELKAYTQTYDNTDMDASLLVLAQVGFVVHDDERMLGTVARIEQQLMTPQGFLMRYPAHSGSDGLPPGEGVFLACSYWLVEQYARTGRLDDAIALMDRLVALNNELGLVSEEYDVTENRMAGNFPQAFSHLALVNASDAIEQAATVR